MRHPPSDSAIIGGRIKCLAWPLTTGACERYRNGKRYYEIFYRDKGTDLHARVGDNDPLERELVVAIFRAKHTTGPFMVCTPNRGVVRGGPIFASGDATAVEFDPGEVPPH